jgi:Zn-dependent protease
VYPPPPGAYAPPVYPPVYPPPPEYYQPRPAPSAAPIADIPAPPPEHAPPDASYPSFAPDGRVETGPVGSDAPPQGKGRGSAAAGVAAGGSVLLGLLAKFTLVLKLLLPLGSALVSFGLYAWYGGWQFGLGLVALLFVHEMGHFIVIRAKGLPASLPVFIPFLGAYVAMRRMPHNVRDEAEIAIAGPLAGALGGVACFLLYEQTGIQMLLFLAYFSFFLNLLNLVPVSPLDGGRIVGAISRWLWPVGLILLAVAFFYTLSILILILGWLWISATIARFRMSRAMEEYYRVSLPVRLYISVLYFGLGAGLGVAMWVTQQLLQPGSGGL